MVLPKSPAKTNLPDTICQEIPVGITRVTIRMPLYT
ncbi:MAG: hypothetical protein KatS3mg051_0422 [Anaerolineae bacterium]|nr:MAG: hypothetical protein KatS3mg051_0422 [Anaerolineae bacterium]